MKKIILSVLVAFICLSNAVDAKALDIETKEVAYSAGTTTLKGFMAWPKLKDANKKVPGVLVVHEWWGQNEYARSRAKQLAELGYAAFALDMYGDGKTAENPKDAGMMMNEAISSGKLKARFDAALDFLRKESIVDSQRVAAIGYCFGGNVVLSMALTGEPLKAVVSFHGSMPEATTASKDVVKAAILILTGEADQMVPREKVETFVKVLDNAKIENKVVFYPKAQHAFTNPEATKLGTMHGIPIGYNKDADEKSWKEMKSLFRKVL